jgi:hypothetical protein
VIFPHLSATLVPALAAKLELLQRPWTLVRSWPATLTLLALVLALALALVLVCQQAAQSLPLALHPSSHSPPSSPWLVPVLVPALLLVPAQVVGVVPAPAPV